MAGIFPYTHIEPSDLDPMGQPSLNPCVTLTGGSAYFVRVLHGSLDSAEFFVHFDRSTISCYLLIQKKTFVASDGKKNV